MTVTENINPKVIYEGPFEKDQTLFFAFPYTDKDDIMCRAGTEDLVYNVDYEVEGQSVKLLKQIEGKIFTVYRRTPLDQQAEFPQNQRFNSAKLNDALDKLCMQQQEQREWLGRCVTADISMEGFNGELPLPQGDNVLKWNSDATALENYDIIGENNKFKEEVRTDFATLDQELDTAFEAFKGEVVDLVEEVQDAAEKINQLEASVEEAKQAAAQASASEGQAETAASMAMHQAESAEAAATEAQTAAAEAVNKYNETINSVKTTGQQQITNVQSTGQQQVTNVQSVGQAQIADIEATGINTRATVDLDNLSTAGNTRFDEKVDKSDMVEVPTIIEVSDPSLMPSWYRVYSDGWCEQGGKAPLGNDGEYKVTFLKEFKDTDYSILKTNNWFLDTTVSFKWINFWGKTTTQATTYNAVQANSGSGFSWEARGYIK